MPTQSQKAVWWKIIVGMSLIIIEIKNQLFPSANLLKANDVPKQLGMYVAMVAIVGVGCWLVYSGIKPIRPKAE